jgi:hypothetical protein
MEVVGSANILYLMARAVLGLLKETRLTVCAIMAVLDAKLMDVAKQHEGQLDSVQLVEAAIVAMFQAALKSPSDPATTAANTRAVSSCQAKD